MANLDDYIQSGGQLPTAPAKPAQPADFASFDFRPLSEIEPSPPRFLIFPYFRRANWNTLSGAGSTGKTAILMSFSAALTRGEPMEGLPGAFNVEGPVNVGYLGSEDGRCEYSFYADIQGVEKRRFYVPKITPDFSRLDVFEAFIRDYGIKFLLLDPLQSFMPPVDDMNSVNTIRSYFNAIALILEQFDCTAVNVSHLNKNAGLDNSQRVSGSSDIVNRSRSVCMAGFNNEGEHVFGHIKSNGAPLGSTYLYSFDGDGRVVWNDIDLYTAGTDIRAFPPRKQRIQAADPNEQLARLLVSKGGGRWEGRAREAVEIADNSGIGGISEVGFSRYVRSHPIPGLRFVSGRRSYITLEATKT